MSLDEFKTIFWWEWSHRFLGRAIGVVFLLPFLFFLWRGGLPGKLKSRLWLILALGAVQGAVGWWMVVSGLSGRTEVSQYRLAVHLMLALAIYVLIVWTVLRLQLRGQITPQRRLKTTSIVILGLTFLQIYFGALVAGLRAGRVFNTWPLIDGVFIPSLGRLLFEQPWWRNFFDSTLTVQFSHRMLAYVLTAVVILHAIDACRAASPVRNGAPSTVRNGALWLTAATLLQAALGILTLLNSVPLDLALAHQAGAVLVLTLALLQVERLGARPVGSDIATAPTMAGASV